VLYRRTDTAIYVVIRKFTCYILLRFSSDLAIMKDMEWWDMVLGQ
jgi:hypothetical protein